MVECTVLCFQLAQEMIDVLYSNFNHETVTGPVPAWWFGVLFIYTAATVLLAKRLQPLGKHHIPCADTQDDAWERAIQMLQAYSRVSQSAQRCIAALEILLAKVQNSGLNRSSEGGTWKEGFPLTRCIEHRCLMNRHHWGEEKMWMPRWTLEVSISTLTICFG
uniref:Uncharacterized protein n=1 Tax=Bionectria ochroleuca TaxID=29856 RepID=A0A8H7K500_BIOOC